MLAYAAPRPQSAPHWKAVWKRRVAKYGRWLHIYVSMGTFAVVLFFAVTGLTLNHAEYFSGAERTARVDGALDARWTSPTLGQAVAKLEVAEYLRKTHGLRGAVSDFSVDDAQCSVSFKGPGYSADAFVDRATGRYEVTVTTLGLAAVLNDLHKGRDSGPVWKALIDISAGLLTLVSLTGLLLLYFIHRHRLAGLAALLGGCAFVYLVYAVWVP